jgi:hypothetical protein
MRTTRTSIAKRMYCPVSGSAVLMGGGGCPHASSSCFAARMPDFLAVRRRFYRVNYGYWGRRGYSCIVKIFFLESREQFVKTFSILPNCCDWRNHRLCLLWHPRANTWRTRSLSVPYFVVECSFNEQLQPAVYPQNNVKSLGCNP